MKKFQIIPAIDIIAGKCVRLTKGDYNLKSSYSLDPLAQTKKFERDGFEQLHIIDLDGAKSGKNVNTEIIRQIVASTNLQVQIGGGFRTPEVINEFLGYGVDQIIVSSVLFAPEFDWNLIDRDRITVSIDIKNGKVMINGWVESTGKSIKMVVSTLNEIGIKRVIVTDVSRDGTLSGPNIKLASEFKEKSGMEVLVAGGVRNVQDIRLAKSAGLEGTIIGKALYEKSSDILQFVD